MVGNDSSPSGSGALRGRFHRGGFTTERKTGRRRTTLEGPAGPNEFRSINAEKRFSRRTHFLSFRFTRAFLIAPFFGSSRASRPRDATASFSFAYTTNTKKTYQYVWQRRALRQAPQIHSAPVFFSSALVFLTSLHIEPPTYALKRFSRFNRNAVHRSPLQATRHLTIVRTYTCLSLCVYARVCIRARLFFAFACAYVW